MPGTSPEPGMGANTPTHASARCWDPPHVGTWGPPHGTGPTCVAHAAPRVGICTQMVLWWWGEAGKSHA